MPSNPVILEVVSTLMDEWRGRLISRPPQVFSHCKGFLVKISTMDRLLSHD